MKAKDLIIKLQELIDEGKGDLAVTMFADHGQYNEHIYCVCLQFTNGDGECIAEDDLGDYEDDEYDQVIELS
jgi:hypothetical protein|tara:strand:+ start:15577 stop:15792 length:216 start_codon:yes stop_codon:yes gene_type:complete